MDPARILVIRTGGLGDTLLLWPALAGLRRRFPRASIDLMGHRERCELLAVPGGVDLAVDVEGSGLHHLFDISARPPAEVRARFGSYQVVLVFAAPGDYALAENLSACGAAEVHAFLPTPSRDERVHVADHAARVLANVDMSAEGEAGLLPVRESESAEADVVLRSLGLDGQRFAVLVPGSGSPAKNWAAERYARLAGWLRERGLIPLVMQGPADEGAVRSVLEAVPGAPLPVWRHDRLAALKGMLARAVLALGNDSGPIHLAAMVGVPTVAVFGPTDPVWWAPRGPAVRVASTRISCSPCPAETMRACQDRVCLDDLGEEEVLEACRQLL